MNQEKDFLKKGWDYKSRLFDSIDEKLLKDTYKLASIIHKKWESGNKIFLCGNGGSAANAIHIANDLHYGILTHSENPTKLNVRGLKVEALSSNQAVVTCLANDLGYRFIYSHQLIVKSSPGDHLIILSGSGKSDNVVEALKVAEDLSMSTTAIVAFDGGLCKEIANDCIHIKTFDMQIAEDVQLIIAHLCMQFLRDNQPKNQKN